MPKYFYDEKYFESWDPKIHGPHHYLQSFYVDALVDECRNEKHYPIAIFRNGISKKTRSSYKVTINNGTPLSSSDYEMASKKTKNCCATFGKK